MSERFGAFEKSLRKLEEVLHEKKTEISRDAAIKRFEFVFELAWKCTQLFLRGHAITCRSPKECMKEAFAFGLVADDPKLLTMIEDRNNTVHTYNEKLAEEIYGRLEKYSELFRVLLGGLKKRMQDQ